MHALTEDDGEINLVGFDEKDDVGSDALEDLFGEGTDEVDFFCASTTREDVVEGGLVSYEFGEVTERWRWG